MRLIYGMLFLFFCLVMNTSAQTPSVTPVPKTVADISNTFAIDVYKTVSSKEGNVFFSPYSISSALAMTLQGADGKTKKEMQQTLHATDLKDPAFIHDGMRSLMKDFRRIQSAELKVANRLWAQKDFHFEKRFTSALETNYGAGLALVDYKRQTEKARREINAWVEDQTAKKIKELIKEGVLSSLTRMVLTNAIYFKGQWEKAFKKSATQNRSFWNEGKQDRSVPFMNAKMSLQYTESDDVQVVELPYKKEELSMFIVLPRKREGMAALESLLTADKLKEWTTQMYSQEVALSLPRFKLSESLSLKESLQKLGMLEAFDEQRADFGPMTGRAELFISAVVHKAFVDVNEEGTEAAAATGVVMTMKSMPSMPKAVLCDHPFLFTIVEKKSGTILFMGKVVKL